MAFAQPEGLAAVKAFRETPRAESKTCAIVDVGAGTTEVSFFFKSNGRIMTERGQPPGPSCLADSTQPVGGGRIDQELAQARNRGAEQARRRKEDRESKLPIVRSVGEIRVQYERTCYEIVKCHKLTAAGDKRFDLFVIGGDE